MGRRFASGWSGLGQGGAAGLTWHQQGQPAHMGRAGIAAVLSLDMAQRGRHIRGSLPQTCTGRRPLHGAVAMHPGLLAAFNPPGITWA
jgi:hypothetical protein